jgi:hypothetical protein
MVDPSADEADSVEGEHHDVGAGLFEEVEALERRLDTLLAG